MNLVILDNLVPDDSFIAEIHPGMWLMDDHRWAYWAWENYRIVTNSSERFSLVHLDYHFDAVNDIREKAGLEEKLKKYDLEEIRRLVEEGKYVCFDSFIAPAIIRGWVREVHFFCRQSDPEERLDSDILSAYDTIEIVHTNFDELVETPVSRPYIFDLCLDLFNRKDDKYLEGELWSDNEVLEFVDRSKGLIAGASVITVSLSFGYSGSEDQTRHLAKLVLPRLISHRRNWREIDLG